jgi:hypothetical protein
MYQGKQVNTKRVTEISFDIYAIKHIHYLKHYVIHDVFLISNRYLNLFFIVLVNCFSEYSTV